MRVQAAQRTKTESNVQPCVNNVTMFRLSFIFETFINFLPMRKTFNYARK